MPRVSKAETEKNRQAIELASSQLFREKGLQATSLADLMSAAGLTHGGFYGHFDSKDALAARACELAFEQSRERWTKRIAGKTTPEAALAALVDGYLSPQNRNLPGNGCPMAGLATDVAREPADKPIHHAYLVGIRALLDIQLSVQASGDADVDRSQALAQMSTLVGAMVLARATRGDALSNEFLAAARVQLQP